MNREKHKLQMFRILTEAFLDEDLSKLIAFKGGTALMFFHGLPRFSVDLDFNILDATRKEEVYQKMRGIALQYGRIADEQMKFFGPIIVLDYAKGEPNLKIELSTRFYDNHYEERYLAGRGITVMSDADMFAHKLCALLDRKGMTGRDVFDIHFFLHRATPINPTIIEQRMHKPLQEYLTDCIEALKKADVKELMQNVGELLDGEYKAKMRNGKLIEETIKQLEDLKFIPLLKEYPQNKMPIANTALITNPQGDSVLAATIGGKSYASAVLPAHVKETLMALPKEEDRQNFLYRLAQEYYYAPWLQMENVKATIKR